MGSAGMIDMVFDASLQSSRAERTADIDIKTGLELKGSKLADYNWSFFQTKEDECICAGHRIHDVGANL